MIGMTGPGISKIEAGTRTPSLRVLVAWLEVCDFALHAVPEDDQFQLNLSHLPPNARDGVVRMARVAAYANDLQLEMLKAPLMTLEAASTYGASPPQKKPEPNK